MLLNNKYNKNQIVIYSLYFKNNFIQNLSKIINLNMKCILKSLFIFIIFTNFAQINLEKLTPFSECIKGRILSYTGWEKGGSCSLGSHTNATGPYYIYPAAPNQDLFNNSAQCGVCYEIVGPYGAIRVRVEDYCPKNDELGLCNGDMYHFNVANNGSAYLIGNSDLSNVTFRMVSCGLSGNIKIKTDENIDDFRYSFVVLNHNLAISLVRMNEEGSRTWYKLNRDEYNYWTYDEQTEILFPINIRIYSINGDYVTVSVDELEPGKTYEANGNFNITDNAYFNISTFKKLEKPDNTSECCERDKSEFSPIYRAGIINEGYNNYEQKTTVNYQSNDAYQGKPSMNVKFQSFGKLYFESLYPIRADQYSGISITIKTNNTCSNCLYIRAYDLENKNQLINLQGGDRWRTYKFDFKTLGVENNEFNGIVFYYYKSSSQLFEINIGSIDLIEDPDAPDAGVCFDTQTSNSGGVTPIIPNYNNEKNSTSNSTNQTQTLNETDIETLNVTQEIIDIISDEIIYENITNMNYTNITTPSNTLPSSTIFINKVYVEIISLEVEPDYPQIINIICNSFRPINNEEMVLLFSKKDGSSIFRTESCILSKEEIISSFSCKVPDILSDGVYRVESPSYNNYNIYFSNDILVNNGIISLSNSNNNNNSPNNGNSTIESDQNNYSPIIITQSIEKIVNKGDRITFQIIPIDTNKYHLENNAIIFEDSTNTKVLYLKNCEDFGENNQINSIICTVSNNIMKANYTTLAKEQNITILSGQTINLIGTISTGGYFSENLNQIINTNLTIAQKNNFKIKFDILYYNSSVRPNSLFPHKVSLFGKRNYLLRDLDQTIYDTQILFPNCTAGDYSTRDHNAIGSISCIFPDYVSAGNYSKIESDGFDVMPNSQINLIFPDDFSRSPNSNSTPVRINLSKGDDDSSSSSKKWVIWLIIGILVVILAGIVIVACVVNKKGGDDDDNNETIKSKDENKTEDSQNSQNSQNSQKSINS